MLFKNDVSHEKLIYMEKKRSFYSDLRIQLNIINNDDYKYINKSVHFLDFIYIIVNINSTLYIYVYIYSLDRKSCLQNIHLRIRFYQSKSTVVSNFNYSNIWQVMKREQEEYILCSFSCNI